MSANANIPRPEYPRPQQERSAWLNLNGQWEFEFDPGRSGKERKIFEPGSAAFSKRINVPFCPESKLSGLEHKDFMPAVWYRREFEVPAEWAGERVLICFGAVDYICDVWINGKWAGQHIGGYTSFEFDVTDKLIPGTNTVTVCAEDDQRSGRQPRGKQCNDFYPSGCRYTRTTGIWQTVWLERAGRTYISSFKLTPNIASSRIVIEAELAGDAPGGATVTAETSFGGKNTGSASANSVWKTAILSVDLSEKQLWGPGEPNLYDLKLKVTDSTGRTIDEISSYFGLRNVSIEGDKILINGKTVFQRLVLDQGYYPDGIYTAPSDADLKRDVEISIGLGFNGARLHQKIFEQRFLYWADKLGYLLWEEHANWGMDETRPESIFYFLPEWMEAVKRDYNSPAIIGWCPFNETSEKRYPAVLKTVYDMTKLYDSTRPVIDTSGYVHVITDVFDIHDYDQSPESFGEKLAPMASGGAAYTRKSDKWTYTGQPYFVSEYGGIWWDPSNSAGWGYGSRPQSEQEYIERYDALTSLLLDNPKICALCYTQLYDVETEVNGLYTYDRRAKFDPEIFRRINTKKAAIESL